MAKNQWCLWRAEQFRKDGQDNTADEWVSRADSESAPDSTFRWPAGYNRDSAVREVQAIQPGMPADASDFWVLGALNSWLDSSSRARTDAIGGGGHKLGGGKFEANLHPHGAKGQFKVTTGGKKPGGGAGESAKAHAASAHAEQHGGHEAHSAAHGAHTTAAAGARASGDHGKAGVHEAMANYHKTHMTAATSEHSGPGHEHSERAMAATAKAYGSTTGAGHAEANHAAAAAHDTAAAVHSKEGHTGAAAEHARLAEQHRSVIGSDQRIRPGMMSSSEAHKPAPPRERYVVPVASAKAKAASDAARAGELSFGVKGYDSHSIPLSNFLEVAKLHENAAAEHGSGSKADFHRETAESLRKIGTGAKPRPVYAKYR